MSEVERRTKIGVAWNASATVVGQVVTFVLGIALARLLLPEDFGVFASIFIFTEVATSIVSSGIVVALVQRREIRDEHCSTALLIQLALAALTSAVLVGISPWVGRFFNDPRVGHVLAAMTIYLWILPFVSTPAAILRRRIDFRSTGIAEVSQQLVGGGVAVALALYGFGVWSLVAGRLSGYLFNAVHLTRLARWRPSLRYSREARKDLVGFGSKVVVVNALNDVATNVDYFMVGRLLGAAPLGYYYRAYHLMTLPVTRITTATNNVLLSAFSEVQEQTAELRRGILKAMCYVSLITFPALTGLFWVAPALIATVYGPPWVPSVPPLRIMCFAGMLLSIEPIAVSAVIAKGQVGFELKRQAIYLVVLLILVPLGSLWGIEGVAVAVLVAAVLFLLMLERLLKSLVGIDWRDLTGVLAPAAVGCIGMSAVLWPFQMLARRYVENDSVWMLGASVVIGIAVYAILFRGLGRWVREPIARDVIDELAAARRSMLRRVLRRS